MKKGHPLRPFVLGDTMALRELFAQSIEELTQEDYDEDQRAAWASAAEDAEEFAERLEEMTTLVVSIDGEYAGFASLKDNKHLEMLYVHPYHVGQGVGVTLVDAMERIAAGRGATEITVKASDTAEEFFKRRGYIGLERTSVPVDDLWLFNTTMKKVLKESAKAAGKDHKETEA